MPRRYAQPPVVEALCEIFFHHSKWDPTVPGVFYQSISDRFPTKQEIKQVDLAVELGKESAATKMSAVEPRSRFLSADASRMVQVGRDLLVVNQLKPYPRFEDWQPLITEMLQHYRDIASPAGIQKIGLRYINRVTIPETGHPMESYFRLYPEVPQTLGSAHGQFFLRLQIPARHGEHALIVTFGSTGADDPNSSAYLLDLYDICSAGEQLSVDLVNRRTNEAHENVEHAFENIITDKARALFGEVE